MLCLAIDQIFFKCVDKEIKDFVLKESHSEELKLNN